MTVRAIGNLSNSVNILFHGSVRLATATMIGSLAVVAATALHHVTFSIHNHTIIVLLVVVVVVVSPVLLVAYLFYPALVAAQHSHDPDLPVELLAITPTTTTMTATTTTKLAQQQQQPLLSLVIPAYNEQERLPVMLRAACGYLLGGGKPRSPSLCLALETLLRIQQQQQQESMKEDASSTNASDTTSLVIIEWIVVSDGSTDDTRGAYQTFVEKEVRLPTTTTTTSNTNTTNTNTNISNNTDSSRACIIQMLWKFMQLPVNAGKGAAVQAGMLAATGRYRLMVDADGATEFGPGLEAVTTAIVPDHDYNNNNNTTTTTVTVTTKQSGRDIAIGSRAHLSRPSFWRRIPSQLFHGLMVWCVGSGAARHIQDTQCGFKLFQEHAATDIFAHLHLRRWAFDTEVIYLATHLGYALVEVPVPWTEVEGSKLHTSLANLVGVAVGMLRDMMCVRLCYSTGLWSTTTTTTTTTIDPTRRRIRGSDSRKDD